MQPDINQIKAGEHSVQEIINSLSFPETNISEKNRSEIDFVLSMPPKWSNIAYLLYSNNRDKAKDFLVRILKISPDASESEKATELLGILNEYSDHSFKHSEEVKSFFEYIDKLKDADGFEAFRDIDFKKLASAMEKHDIGKLGMPARILNPPPLEGIKYTDADNIIKETHPTLGYLILKSLGFSADSQRLALTHHLRYKTINGELKIVGYPVDDFKKYCEERGEKFELTAEDQLASFVDVFSASTDPNRPSDVFGIKKEKKNVFDVMDSEVFKDPYYQTGGGAPLYLAFKMAAEASKALKKRAA